MKHMTVTPGKAGAYFESGLFGVNAEITRKGFFGGLSAEMLNNRKFFAGGVSPSGWVCDNFEYIKDRPDQSLCESSFILLKNGSAVQTSDVISTVSGRKYISKVWIRAFGKSTVTFGLKGYEKSFEAYGGGEKYTVLTNEFYCDDVSSGSFIISVNGSAYVFEASLMPEDNYYGMRRDVIDALKYIRPSSIRFPGGCAADHFDWKESLKAPEFRRPVSAGDKWFLFRDTYDQDCLDVGLNEFIMLCRETRAEPEYTISLLLSDRDDAHDIVEYCNGGADTVYGAKRQSLGFDRFDIKLFYIGNEVYFFGGVYKDDPVLAARKTSDLIRGVKSADEAAETVIGLTWPPDFQKWNRDFIAALDCSCEYVSYHNYIGILPDQTQGDNGLATPDMLERIFSDSSDPGLDFYKDGLYKNGFDTIKVCADEWNYAWGRGSSNALFFSNALQFHFFAKSREKYHVVRADFFMPVNEGMITVDGASVRVESTGELFRAMQGHMGGRTVGCTSDPSLDVLCTDHGGDLFISVVNRGAEPVCVDVKGYEVSSATQINTYGYDFDKNDFKVVKTDLPAVYGHGVLFAVMKKR